METQVRIKRIIEWVEPYFGNRHTMPYGKIEVTDGETTKICSTKGDTLETWPIHQCQYITFKRKAYKLVEYRDGTKYKLKLEPIN